MIVTNVLFLGGAKRVSFAEHLIKTGKEYELNINIFSYELEKKVPIAAVGTVIIGKKWKDVDILDDLQSVIVENDIKIVLPFVDPAIAVVSKIKEKCPDIFAPISDVAICETMFNKALSADWFAKYDVPQPIRYKHEQDYRYPVILKPVFGSASKGILVCQSAKELPAEGVDNAKYLVQNYIAHRTEYTVDCYISQLGEIISIVPRIRLETAGGEVIKSITVRNEKIIKSTKKILNTKAFRGPITVQYIEDNDSGEVYVMEINPRLGGGVITSIEANSRLINAMLDEYLTRTPQPFDNWEEGLLLTRYFKEVIFHADNY